MPDLDDDIWIEKGNLIKFNQWEFVAGYEAGWGFVARAESGLEEYGWLYYPDHCIGGGCNLGVFLHGCFQKAIDYAYKTGIDNDLLIDQSGWSQIGYENDIVLLFPQVAEGCWNVHGFEEGNQEVIL